MPLRVICAICRFLLRAIFPLNPNKVLPLLASIVSWQQTPPCGHVVIVLKCMQRKLDLGKRRKNLTDRFYGMLDEMFVDRIIDWTSAHARIWAQFMEVRRRRGEPLDNHLPDAMIASTAKYLGLTVVTRNEKEFRSTGVRSVNPWARKSV